MSATDDDAELAAAIAKAAAARGLSVTDLQQRARARELEERRISMGDVDSAFSMPPNTPQRRADEFAVFDILPPASRRAIREAPLAVCARRYAELLERLRDERVLIGALRERAAVARPGAQPYGPDFPRRRKRG